MNDDDYSLEDMGLVVSRWRMLWALRHGGLRWTPYWFRKGLITVWNRIACVWLGHDFSFLDRCTWCCKQYTPPS